MYTPVDDGKYYSDGAVGDDFENEPPLLEGEYFRLFFFSAFHSTGGQGFSIQLIVTGGFNHGGRSAVQIIESLMLTSAVRRPGDDGHCALSRCTENCH